MYGEGISLEGDVLDLGVAANLIDKSGAWFSYNGERMGQGRDQAKEFLKSNPNVTEEVRNKLLSNHGIGKLLLDADTKAEHANDQDELIEDVSPSKTAKSADKKKSKH